MEKPPITGRIIFLEIVKVYLSSPEKETIGCMCVVRMGDGDDRRLRKREREQKGEIYLKELADVIIEVEQVQNLQGGLTDSRFRKSQFCSSGLKTSYCRIVSYSGGIRLLFC